MRKTRINLPLIRAALVDAMAAIVKDAAGAPQAFILDNRRGL